MMKNLFQLGEPVEHRGIVVAPLFPTRDPEAAYVTLDEALPRGLAITEIDESGSVPELAVDNPLDARCSCTTAKSSSARSRTASST